ncbi:MAG: hypothetical protein KDB07_04290, partial [Planctomycetes bacterium]|nr:hypothetical protein [Planctomycetota bacterium]
MKTHGLVARLCALFLISLAILTSGCGGGGGGSSSGVVAHGTVTGQAVKGQFSSGVAEAWSVNTDGSPNQLLGMADLMSDGGYSIDIGMHVGPVLIIIRDGMYNHEATGTPTAQTQQLRVMIPDFTMFATMEANATPLTEFASAQARRNAGMGMGLADSINRANNLIGQYFGVDNLITTRPVDLSMMNAMGVTNAVRNYSVTLAGFAQLANTLGFAPDVLINAIANDGADELFDGMFGGNMVMLGGNPLSSTATRGDLGMAMQMFINGARNMSGFDQNAVQGSID